MLIPCFGGFAVEAGDGGSTVLVDWSTFATGTDFHSVSGSPAGWTMVGHSSASGEIVDGSYINGKALRYNGTASFSSIHKDEVATLCGGAYTTFEMLALWTLPSVNAGNRWWPAIIGTGATTGVDLSGIGIREGSCRVWIQDDVTSTTGSNGAVSVTASERRYFRVRYDGTNIRGRTWVRGGAEPGTWNIAEPAYASGLTWMGIGWRGEGTPAIGDCEGMSFGFDASAPSLE